MKENKLNYYYIKKLKVKMWHKRKKILSGYGDGTLNDRVYQKWLAKFCFRNFSLNESLWSIRLAD